MSQTIIRDCRVWDGSGKAAFPADLLIEGGRIHRVARNRGQLDGGGAEVIEAGGMTLMPGLVEGHAHISFGNAVAATDLGDLPPEEHTLLTARNAKTLLDHGFTSAYSAASAKLRLDIVIRFGQKHNDIAPIIGDMIRWKLNLPVRLKRVTAGDGEEAAA